MKTIYLHIGSPKTGTTSIQHMLGQNADVLKKYGICYPIMGFQYPEVGPYRNAHFLIAANHLANRDPDHPLLSKDYVDGLDQLQGLCAGYDTILLSDEGIFHTTGKDAGFWPRLREDLNARGFSLKIILYLRRQDLFVQSLYAQRVKKLYVKDPFDVFLADLQEKQFPLDYCAYLDHLADTLGKDALIVRIFESGQFLGAEGTLLSDFLQIFGLSLSDGFSVEEENLNARLERADLELKRILNQLPASRPSRHLIQNALLQHRPASSDTSYTFFEPGKQREFLSQMEESNRRLAKRYLHREDGAAFHEPLVELPTLRVSDREMIESLILSYGRTLENLNTRLNLLQKEIENQKKKTILSRIRQKLKTRFLD